MPCCIDMVTPLITFLLSAWAVVKMLKYDFYFFKTTEIKTPHIFVLEILQMIPHINPQKYLRNTMRNTMLDKDR